MPEVLTNPEPAVFNMKGFCLYVGISQSTGWRLVNTYAVPHERPTPKTVRISKADADDFRAKRRVTNHQEHLRVKKGLENKK